MTITDPKKITLLRKAQRDAMTPELRQIQALELIADTLEAMRIDGTELQRLLDAVL